MSSVLPISLQGIRNLPEVSQNLPLDFQSSIKSGDINLLKQLILKGVSVNQALPNGEMPLHLAVRADKQEVVSALLQQGADPEIKDFQGLTAIDHSVLMKNENILATILGQKIGKELKGIQEQIKCKGSASHVNQLKSHIQMISTVDTQKLTPINRAAYDGNVDELTKQASAETVNHLDVNGLTPIHYAILGNQIGAVEKLIELGSKVNMVNQDGDSLLHFAAISRSPRILTLLMGSGADLNQKNSKGATALHYASAKENLAVVELLVKGGANPHLLDNQGMSPLALIGTSAFQRDPLSLPTAQIVLFAATCLYWLSKLALDVSDQTQLLVLLALSIPAAWSEFGVLVTNLDKNWKKGVAWIGFMGLAAIPPLNVGFSVWKTYHVARSAFEGLRSSWRNAGYRNWAATRNVVVYSVNTIYSAHQLYLQCAVTYELYLGLPYAFRMWNASRSDDWDAYYEAYADYLRFMQDRYNIGNDVIDISQCAKIDPATLKGISDIDRLRRSELNPKCPEHALMMISPDFTMDELKSKGMSLFKKTYRQMMANGVHPDKARGSKELEEAAVRLNAAAETLEKWVEKMGNVS